MIVPADIFLIFTQVCANACISFSCSWALTLFTSFLYFKGTFKFRAPQIWKINFMLLKLCSCHHLCCNIIKRYNTISKRLWQMWNFPVFQGPYNCTVCYDDHVYILGPVIKGELQVMWHALWIGYLISYVGHSCWALLRCFKGCTECHFLNSDLLLIFSNKAVYVCPFYDVISLPTPAKKGELSLIWAGVAQVEGWSLYNHISS